MTSRTENLFLEGDKWTMISVCKFGQSSRRSRLSFGSMHNSIFCCRATRLVVVWYFDKKKKERRKGRRRRPTSWLCCALRECRVRCQNAIKGAAGRRNLIMRAASLAWPRERNARAASTGEHAERSCRLLQLAFAHRRNYGSSPPPLPLGNHFLFLAALPPNTREREREDNDLFPQETLLLHYF